MNFYIPDNLIKEGDFNNLLETFVLIPFISQERYNKIYSNMKWWGDSLFSKLRINKPVHNICSKIEDSDVAILPYKFNLFDNRIKEINDFCKKQNKKLICFYEDDNSQTFNLDENIILFRTSLIKSNKQKNERIFPVLIPDSLDYFEEPLEQKISFIGSCPKDSYRDKILNQVNEIMGDKCDFVKREGFWHFTNTVNIKGRREFFEHIKNNKYTLCVRNVGNFSYRFYESLCMGRIPILIDTDCELPLKTMINWENHIIKIKENEIKHLKEIISNDKIKCQDNRNLWEKYLSPSGYFKNFVYDI